MSYKGAPVYLRDLSPECRQDFVSGFNSMDSATRAVLLNALGKEEDIIVGYYLPSNEVRPA